ncbi:MAG TPA: hypothetical protein VN600_13645 [Gemmatimonadaceae bacterium]|nr:hypothetical protein [Gemmatimonadaceae bacterium]
MSRLQPVFRYFVTAVLLFAGPLAAQDLSAFHFRSIGPASMGGRVDDIEVAPSDPNVIYIGYATGGVFKSVNNATSFEPVFETYGSASIGDIAIHPTNPNIVYVGTGEANNRQSSTFGDGLYKSTDGGKTFTNIGLKETQTIARIVIDPKDPETVYVAALGHLFGPNGERGIYKTTDGGATWTKIKYVDDNTGFTDIAIDPSDSRVLYAASYQRRRSGCCYNGGGAGSALWKSDDAGRTWTKLTNGLPATTLGRIAIDVSRSNPNVVYAQMEVESNEAGGGAGGGRGGAGGYDWCNNAGPGRGFGGGRGGAAGAAGAQSADSNRTPPALDAKHSGIFRSDDRGKSWHVVSNCDGRPLYFSQLRVDPSNPNTVFVANVHPARSTDGGKTFLTLDAAGGFFNMGEDQHALWIDPRNSNHILRGNDAGFAVSWDEGATWEYVRTMATGLAYWVTADMGHPYYVYTGLQDNDSWSGPSATRSRVGITAHDWFHLTGGDGFQTAVDPTDFHTIYSEQQDGGVNRTDLRTGRSESIRPVAPPAPRGGRGAAADSSAAGEAPETCIDGRIVTAGAGRGGRGGAGGAGGGRGNARPNVTDAQPGDAYRFNWNTPVLLSPHDPKTLWLGGNRLFKSSNKGASWTASADLTKHIDRCTIDLMGAAGTAPQLSKNDGVSSYGTIVSISESPVTAGVVWVGTDDGNLQVSRDGGTTFTEVGKNIRGLPQNALGGTNPYWISRIDASHFDAATAYVAVDGHRADDLAPYVFATHDYGQTFRRISANLPSPGNVETIREDPKNRGLLFAGTDFGLYVSLDAGAHWQRFRNDLPTVRVDEVLVHPRDGDLIVATHGRSLWIADDITPLEQFTPAVAAQDVAMFDVRPAIAYLFDYRTDADEGGDKRFDGTNPARGTAISYYLRAPATGDVKLAIADPSGRTVCTSTGPATAGIHRMQWTLVTPMVAADSAAEGRGGGGGVGGGGIGGGRGNATRDLTCDGSGGRGGAGGGRGGAAPAIAAGTYTAKLTVNGHDYTKPVAVLEDIWMYER